MLIFYAGVDPVLKKIKRVYRDSKISTKIMTIYSAILILSVMLSAFIYQNIYNRTLSKKISEVSVQTLHSISSNIFSMVDNAKNLSKVILASNEVQKSLKEANSDNIPYTDTERIINAHVSRFIEAFPFISSIYIFDTQNQRYGIDKLPLKSLKINDITEAGWYQDAVDAQGGFILRLNAGDIYKDLLGEKYISLIRIINDIYTQKPIGTLILNISDNSFKDSYKDILDEYGTDIMILDQNDNIVVDFSEFDISSVYRFIESENQNSAVENINGKDYIISVFKIQKYDWSIISIIPFEELSKESHTFNAAALSIIIFNAFLMFLGSLAVSKMISTPIKKLLNSMKGVKKGEFEKVDIDAGNDEIGSLRDAYNIMITEIKNLINKVVHEQRIKRKAELNVLQAQVKPHFLYNTFDAISSLALLGKNDEVYKVMKFLGSYYRVSLSKGSEVISIKDEINVVKNYMSIQHIRYGDIFDIHYEIDERAVQYKVPKLILQPLVENSLYHGIKPKGEKGNIIVRVRYLDNFVELSVEDDGVGMKKEDINKILNGDHEKDEKSGFGIRGTIERIKIFYGINNPVAIESSKNGTKIIIRIPAREVS
jgi:two-component system sensor histidine kinase YesM